jgi:hypothetical protein
MERKLSSADLKHFVNEGFLRVSGAIADWKVENCLRKINHTLGVPGSLSSGGAQRNLGKLDGGVSTSEEVKDLLVGEGSAKWLCDLFARDSKKISDDTWWWSHVSAQIAIRFPEPPENLYRLLALTEIVARGEAWHTDGLRRGKNHPFSVLLGVALSDCTEEWQGNLLVYPKKHHVIHKCLSNTDSHGFDAEMLSSLLGHTAHDMRRNDTDTAAEVDEGSESDQQHDNMPPLPPIGAPRCLLLKKGDVVLLHPDLPHSGGANWGANIRMMVYFRITFTDGEGAIEGHLQDPFHDFSSELRDIYQQREQ